MMSYESTAGLTKENCLDHVHVGLTMEYMSDHKGLVKLDVLHGGFN